MNSLPAGYEDLLSIASALYRPSARPQTAIHPNHSSCIHLLVYCSLFLVVSVEPLKLCGMGTTLLLQALSVYKLVIINFVLKVSSWPKDLHLHYCQAVHGGQSGVMYVKTHSGLCKQRWFVCTTTDISSVFNIFRF